jgi:phasin
MANRRKDDRRAMCYGRGSKRVAKLHATKAQTPIHPVAIPGDPDQDDLMTQNPFEFPQQMRDLAEKNVEQARATFGQFMDAMTQAMGMWSTGIPAGELSSGFKVVQDRAVRFAKQNAEAGFALASELANAKDFQDVLSLQSRYAQTQMQAYALQAQELGRLMTEAVQGMQPKR